MGAAYSESISNVKQRAVNETYQRAENSCTAECNQIQSGTTIVLDNTTAGDITFTQRCTADASCYMTNALEASVVTFQKADAISEAAPSLFPGFQINKTKATTDTEIQNQMTQIMNNLCEGSVNQVQEEQVIYATDSTVGNIGFTQEGNAFARCVMENSGRLELQMRQEGSATALSGAAASGLGGLIALVIIVVVVIIILKNMKKKEGEEGDPNDPSNPANRNKRTGLNSTSVAARSNGTMRQSKSLAGKKSGTRGKIAGLLKK